MCVADCTKTKALGGPQTNSSEQLQQQTSTGCVKNIRETQEIVEAIGMKSYLHCGKRQYNQAVKDVLDAYLWPCWHWRESFVRVAGQRPTKAAVEGE